MQGAESPGGDERELRRDVAERALRDARRYGIEPHELAEAVLRAAELDPSSTEPVTTDLP